jgi:hypothetical protein
MAKNIKMVLYGEPGVGKSTFAAGAPRPFFITTDGNYEYLEDFCGMRAEDHQQCFSWAEMKKAFARDFFNYDTIVVDLLEDSYLWADNEFCRDNKLLHISDLGYGKGYGILGNEFFIEYQKLLALPKNIILLMHGVTEVLKDRRGVEYSKYGPSKLLRDKIVTQLEGRVRFFVRAYAEASEGPDGRLQTKRYLSLSPDGHTEYGITRGLSSDAPHSIPLDWNAFVTTVDQYTLKAGQSDRVTATVGVDALAMTLNAAHEATEAIVKAVEGPAEPTSAKPAPKPRRTRKPAAKAEPAPEPTETKSDIDDVDAIRKKLAAVLNDPNKAMAPTPIPKAPENGEEDVCENYEVPPFEVDKPAAPAVAAAQPAAEPVAETPAPAMTQAEKLAAIRAKMAALKNK